MRGLIFLMLIGLASNVSAQEVAVPDTPVPATVTEYKVTCLTIQSEPDYRLKIEYQDSNGKTYTDEHYGPEMKLNAEGVLAANPESAHTLMRSINTGDFRSTSLTKRIFQHLVQHGKIPNSTVTGTPGPPVIK